jgi:hypothetical protein
MRRAPVVSGAARTHFALLEDLAMRTHELLSPVAFDHKFGAEDFANEHLYADIRPLLLGQ